METNKGNKQAFKEAVDSMKPEIDRQFGEAAGEIHKNIEVIGSIGESMKEMREESKGSEGRIMDAIKEDKIQGMNDLKAQISAKDARIEELIRQVEEMKLKEENSGKNISIIEEVNTKYLSNH